MGLHNRFQDRRSTEIPCPKTKEQKNLEIPTYLVLMRDGVVGGNKG